MDRRGVEVLQGDEGRVRAKDRRVFSAGATRRWARQDGRRVAALEHNGDVDPKNARSGEVVEELRQ